MRLDDLRDELRTIADETPPVTPTARSVMRPAARRLWSRRIIAGAVAVAVVSGAVVTLTRDQHHGRRLSISGSGPAGTTPSRTAGTIANGRWSAMASFPLQARSGETVIWTGSQMIVWGGHEDEHVLGNGAAYDPDTNSWRVLPPAPISARTEASAVWTGREMIVWGGGRSLVGNYTSDGAAFDPAAWKWRRIAGSALAPRYSADMVWTGSEAIVFGGYETNTGDLTSALDAAAYDPATDRWRPIASLPAVGGAAIENLSSAWTGKALLVWELWSRTSGTLRSFGLQLVEYDPKVNDWKPGPATDDPHRNVYAPIWIGERVLVPATRPLCDLPDGAENCGPPRIPLHGSEFDPATGDWTSIPHGPVDDGAALSVWTGDDLVVMSSGTVNPTNGNVIEQPGSVAAWSPRTNTWASLPRPLFTDTADTMLWTGRDILVWGSGHGIRYEPASSDSGTTRVTVSTSTTIPQPKAVALPAVGQIPELKTTVSASFPWGSATGSIGVYKPTGCCGETSGPAVSTIDGAGNVRVFDEVNWRIVANIAGRPSASPLDAPIEGVSASAFDAQGRLIVAGYGHLMVFAPNGARQDSYPLAKFTNLANATQLHWLEVRGAAIVANVDNQETRVLVERNGRYVPQYASKSSVADVEINADVKLRTSVMFTDHLAAPARSFTINSASRIMFIRADRVLPDKSLVAVLAYYVGDTSNVDAPDTLVLVRIRPDGSARYAKFLAPGGYMSATGPVVVADDDGVSVLSSTTTAGVKVARYRYADLP